MNGIKTFLYENSMLQFLSAPNIHLIFDFFSSGRPIFNLFYFFCKFAFFFFHLVRLFVCLIFYIILISFYFKFFFFRILVTEQWLASRLLKYLWMSSILTGCPNHLFKGSSVIWSKKKKNPKQKWHKTNKNTIKVIKTFECYQNKNNLTWTHC